MQDQKNNEYRSGAGCLTRLYWLLIGNALVFFTFIYLVQKHPKFPSLLDAGCLLAVASLVFVRYFDIRYCKGETGDGKPATMGHWRKYSIRLVIGCMGVWLVIRFLVPLFMK